MPRLSEGMKGSPTVLMLREKIRQVINEAKYRLQTG
jgi:hypothetical protein